MAWNYNHYSEIKCRRCEDMFDPHSNLKKSMGGYFNVCPACMEDAADPAETTIEQMARQQQMVKEERNHQAWFLKTHGVRDTGPTNDTSKGKN